MDKNPLPLTRAMPTIAEISDDAQTLVAQMSQKANIISILKAMQEGYAMACTDNGLPVPVFPLLEM